MAVPNLPALGFNSVTVTGGTSASLWIAALASVGTAADDGASIVASSRWVFTSPAAGVCLAVPAATSPIAGKLVLIWGWDASGPAAAAMLAPDTTVANGLFFGMWMADAGATVSAADLTAVWTTNSAASGFTGTGTFSGYTRVYTGVIPSKVTVFLSSDYLIFHLVETTGGIFGGDGGMGIRAPTTSTGVSESGLGGRVFDFGTTGTTAVVAAFLTATAASSGAGLLRSGLTAAQAHHYYRVPGQTTDSSANTMRACSWTADAAALGFALSDAVNCVDADGNIEPEHLPLRDTVGSGARNKTKVGRHRAFFVGPRRKTRAILSAAGVKTWITCGQSETVDNDCYLLPYG